MNGKSNINRRNFLKNSIMGLGGVTLSSLHGTQSLNLNYKTTDEELPNNPPNILLFLADDLNYHDLGITGNEQVKTPNLDRLASQGILLPNTFSSSPMCAPCRMSLYTGIHPVRNGAHPNHSRVYSHIKSLPSYMNDLGYRTAIKGKQHEAPAENFPFEELGGRHHDTGKGDDLYHENVREFMEENKSQPWALVISSNQPHTPWNRGENYLYPSKELQLPPYLIDTPETRDALSNYYAEITYMDRQVGQVLQYLAETGQEKETIVIFLSEQGANFPHCKWTCYDTGVRAAGIIRWPGVVESGRVCKSLIEYVDMLPTLIEAVGGLPNEHDFDGKSFFSLLTGERSTTKEYVFSMQTSRGIYNGPDAYGIRSVRSNDFRLIWNLNWENSFQNSITAGFKPYLSWNRRAEEDRDPFAKKRYMFYQKRPEFELYDLRLDPFELHNLSADPFYVSVFEQLQGELEKWMKRQGDKGIETEMDAKNRQSSRWMN